MAHRHPGILKILETGFLNVRFGGQFESVREIADFYRCSDSSVYLLLDETAEKMNVSRQSLLFFPDMSHKGKTNLRVYTTKKGKKTTKKTNLDDGIREKLSFAEKFLKGNQLTDTLQAVDLMISITKDMRRI